MCIYICIYKFLTDSSAPPLTGQLVGVWPMDPMATTSVEDLSKIFLLSSSPTWCFFTSWLHQYHKEEFFMEQHHWLAKNCISLWY